MDKYLQDQWKTLGDRFRFAFDMRKRERKGLTNATFSRDVKRKFDVTIGASYLSKITTSQHHKAIYPSADKILAFCMELGIDANWLLGMPGATQVEYKPEIYRSTEEGGGMAYSNKQDGIFTVTVSSREEQLRLQEMIELASDIDVGEMKLVIEMIHRIRNHENRIRLVDRFEEGTREQNT